MFIKDKIKPIFVKDFIINKHIIEKYKSLLTNEFISNLYVYGNNGCGKYTIIKCLLNELYKTNINSKIQTLQLNNKEFNILYNNYYFEIILHKYNTNRVQVLNVLEYLTENKDINSICKYKIIIIKNCHLLNGTFITNLKNIIEKYHETIRLILIGKTSSRLLKLLNGIVVPIRIGKPDLNEIKTLFKNNHMYQKNIDIDDLIIKHNYNLNYIFINYEILSLNPKYKTLLETTTDKITKLLIDKKLENITNIREILYNYQVKNLNIMELIYNILYFFIQYKKISNDKKKQIIESICFYDTRLSNSFKELIHIEAFLFDIFKIIHIS